MSDILEQLANYRGDFDAGVTGESRVLSSSPLLHANHEGAIPEMTVLSNERDVTDRRARRRMQVAVLAAAILVALAVVGLRDQDDGTVLAGAPDDEVLGIDAVDPAQPETTIEAYEAAYNARDLDALMSLFDESSVLTDIPFSGTVEGLNSIRSSFLTGFAVSAETDAYQFSNIEASGNTVTWDHTWTNTSRQRYCATGHVAQIADGIITNWEFPKRRNCSTLSAVIDSYAEAYNARDLDALMSLFDESSVIIDSPFSGTVEGLSSIRSSFLTGFAVAAESDAYQLSNVEASGNTVTWDHTWTNTSGQQFCVTGHAAQITDGIITKWEFPPRTPCS